jgi:very-short-patch-repair endonuclease
MDRINDMHYGSNPFTFQKAVELRNSMTKAESVLWEELRNKRFIGLKFRRQHPIGRFIVDFYCHKLKLVIELDGGIHDLPEVAENDKNREEELREFGLNVIRFTNEEILQNTKETLIKMEQIIKSLK